MKRAVGMSLVACGLALASCAAAERPERPADAERELAALLFVEHCAACHGPAGDGDGPAAGFLYPPPRRFSEGRFRLTSALDGKPTRRDVHAMLARGLPGSAMPSWSWLGDEAVGALAGYVIELVELGVERRIEGSELASGEPLEVEDARRAATRAVQPRQRFQPPARVTPNAAVLARGRALYRENCARCHGEDGRGRASEALRNEDGSLNWARDFTAGILKGGASFEALATRIAVGMPGSAMPALDLGDADLAALVTYTASLIPQASEQRLVQRSDTLVARRVARELPTNGADPQWAVADELELVLAPLAWRDDAPVWARLSALHDGGNVALRLRWNDATRDDGGSIEVPNRDGAALAFSNEAAPPLAGMGSQEHPINLWHWRAARPVDLLGVLDLLRDVPHLLTDPLARESRSDIGPVYLPAPSGAVAGGRSVELQAEGFASLRRLEDERRIVAAEARYADGEWCLVFTRSIAPHGEREADFAAAVVRVACALWDGSGGDRGASKSISIWQRLVLE